MRKTIKTHLGCFFSTTPSQILNPGTLPGIIYHLWHSLHPDSRYRWRLEFHTCLNRAGVAPSGSHAAFLRCPSLEKASAEWTGCSAPRKVTRWWDTEVSLRWSVPMRTYKPPLLKSTVQWVIIESRPLELTWAPILIPTLKICATFRPIYNLSEPPFPHL